MIIEVNIKVKFSYFLLTPDFRLWYYESMNTITIPKNLIKIGKESVVILPLKKWQKIEMELEDLEMYRSVKLTKEIAQRRKEKAVVPLKNLLNKYKI